MVLGVGLMALGQAEAQKTATVPTLLSVNIVARYPHDQGAFTEGLQYLGGGQLLESTGIEGESGVRLSDLKTAKIQKQVSTPISDAFGEGATQLGNTIYHLTWQHGTAFAFDAKTLKELGRFRYQGEGWGLTHDGKWLITSDGTPTLRFRNPQNFAVVRSIRATDTGQPVKNLNELEYVDGQIYANVWLSNRIARIDAKTGKIGAWIDVQPLFAEASAQAAKNGKPLTFDDVPNGIAFVPERGTLLLTGKRWPTIFEVKVTGLPTPTSTRKGTKKPNS